MLPSDIYFSALVSLLKYVSDAKELPELVFRTMGGFSGITDCYCNYGRCVFARFIIMMYFSWDLNVMTLQPERNLAISLGVNYKKIRMIAFVLSTLTAVAVSFTVTSV